LLESAKLRAVGQTVAATGAFALNDLVHVVDVLHFRMNRALGTNFTARAAGDAKGFDDFDFHDRALFRVHCAPPNARHGSDAQGQRRKSKTSSIGFWSSGVSA
jgi:hypothetical protein